MSKKINLPVLLDPRLNVKALNTVIQSLKTSLGKHGSDITLIDEAKLKAQLSKVGGKIDDFDDKIKKTKTSTDGLNNSFGGFLKNALMINQATQGLMMFTAAFAPFIDKFVELDKQIKNIGTLGVKNLNEIMEASSEMAVAIPGDAATMANSFYQFVSSGAADVKDGILDMASSMKFVETAAKDAVSGLSDVSVATDLYTSMLNAYGMTADEVGQVSNATFATIKLGKTTFEELSASTATWLPLAASVGVGFDEVNNAIAKMTAQGTPTTQAATQIRAAMVLIQKGGPGLKKALKSQNRSLKEFQDMLSKDVSEGGGLVNALEEIRKVTERSGMTLAAATGRVEASSAIMQLTGKNLEGTQEQFKKLREEMERGVATEAFAIASQSIAAQNEGVMSSLQALFNKAFTYIGGGATKTLDLLTKLSPALMGFASLTPFIGSAVGGIKNIAVALISKYVPAAVTTSAATGTAAVSFRALGTAMTTGMGPVGLLIAALGGLIAAYAIFHKSAEEVAQDQLAEAELEEKAIKRKVEITKAQRNVAKENTKLVGEFKKLSTQYNSTSEMMEDHRDMVLKLAETYPGVIDETKSLGENVEALEKASGKLTEEQRKQVDHSKTLIEEYEALGNKSERNREEQSRYEEIIRELNGIYPDVIGNTGNFTSEIKALKDMANNASGEMLKFNAQLKEMSGQELNAALKTEGMSIEHQITLLKESLSEIGWRATSTFNIFQIALKKATNASEVTKIIQSYQDLVTLQGKVTFTNVPHLDEALKEMHGIQYVGTETLTAFERYTQGMAKSASLAFGGISGDAYLAFNKIKNEILPEIAASTEKTILLDPNSVEGQVQRFTSKYKEELKRAKTDLQLENILEEASGGVVLNVKSATPEKREEILNDLKEFAGAIQAELDKKNTGGGDFTPTLDKKKFKDQADVLAKLQYDRRQRELEASLRSIKDEEILEKNARSKKYGQEVFEIENQIKKVKSAKDISEKDKAALLKEYTEKLLLVETGYFLDLEDISNKYFDKELEGLGKQNKKKAKKGESALETARRLHEEELNELEEKLDKELRLKDRYIDAGAKNASYTIETEFDADVSNLDKMKEDEILTEDAYNQRKEELERQHQAKLAAIEESARFSRLEAERQADEKRLQAQRDRLADELALVDKSKNPDEYNEAERALDATQKALEEKGDLLKVYTGELQGALTEMSANLLAGEDAIKEPFRKGLGAVVGFLKEYLNSVIMKLIFDDLLTKPGVGFMGIVLIPAMRGLISAALGAIVDPIFNSILSFADGGVVTSPTLAIVGDAKDGGSNSNTEYIFNTEILKELFGRQFENFQVALNDAFYKSNSISLNTMGQLTRDLREDFSSLEKYLGNSDAEIDNTIEYIVQMSKMMDNDKAYYDGGITTDKFLENYDAININIANATPNFSSSSYADIHGTASQAFNPEREPLLFPVAQMTQAVYEGTLHISDNMERLFGKLYDVIEDKNMWEDSDVAAKKIRELNIQEKNRQRMFSS
jgi:TP901 family phage tail tape measure protein